MVHRPLSVFVLGHSGMLGHLVAPYLTEQGCEVITSDARYQALPRDPLIEAVRDSVASGSSTPLAESNRNATRQQNSFFQTPSCPCISRAGWVTTNT